MKIKMIPMILMLTAGALTSIICYVLNYEVRFMLIALIIALVVFYAVGDVIRYLMEKYVFFEPKAEGEDEENQEGETEQEDSQNQEETVTGEKKTD